jgi:hypothetical protein
MASRACAERNRVPNSSISTLTAAAQLAPMTPVPTTANRFFQGHDHFSFEDISA